MDEAGHRLGGRLDSGPSRRSDSQPNEADFRPDAVSGPAATGRQTGSLESSADVTRHFTVAVFVVRGRRPCFFIIDNTGCGSLREATSNSAKLLTRPH